MKTSPIAKHLPNELSKNYQILLLYFKNKVLCVYKTDRHATSQTERSLGSDTYFFQSKSWFWHEQILSIFKSIQNLGIFLHFLLKFILQNLSDEKQLRRLRLQQEKKNLMSWLIKIMTLPVSTSSRCICTITPFDVACLFHFMKSILLSLIIIP